MTGTRRRIIAALVLGGLVLATGWGLWSIRPVLAPFLIAIALAYLIAPLVNRLHGLGISRGWAILIVYAVLGLGIGFGVVKLLPRAFTEARRLVESIPAYSVLAREWVDGLQQQVRTAGLPPGLRDGLDRLISTLAVMSVSTLQSLLDFETVRHAAGLLGSILLAPILAFYLLKDIEHFKLRFVRSLPGRYRQEVLVLLRGLDQVLSGFVRGQILLSLAVGSLAVLATTMLGLRYSVLLGMWAGTTEFIPYIGPVLGALPSVVVGLSVSPLVGIETVIAFAIIQQIENAILSPKIMGESIGLHPLAVIFAVLAGGYLVGGWGLILALPLTGLLRVFWCFVVARLTEGPRLTPGFGLTPALRPEGASPVEEGEEKS